jgi:peptidoglycan/LPS O-acetylase OafA/YrhL
VNEQRIDYVDGLRAVAVLTVLAAHVGLHAHGAGPILHAAEEGSHGVDLFFILSGFCLAYPTLRKIQRDGSTLFRVTDYAAKRLVRIVPPFYIATFAFLSIAAVGHWTGHDEIIPLPPPLDVLKTLFFLDGRVVLLNDSFWTLMVEFRWYFVFPILLAVWLRSPRAFCAIGVASALLYAFTRARGLDLGTLPAFMLGIVAADIHIGGGHVPANVASIVKRLALPLAVVCAGAGIAMETRASIPGFSGNDVAWPFQPTIAGWQLAAFFFVVAAGSLAWLRAILSWPVLVATGVASYSIYLVHEPFVRTAFGHVHGPVGCVVAAGGALACGFAFWAIAERPFTTGSLRRPLLDRVAPVVERGFAVLGIAKDMRLGSAEPEPDPVYPSGALTA